MKKATPKNNGKHFSPKLFAKTVPGEWVGASIISRCLDVCTMTLTHWRNKSGLPNLAVRSEQSPLGWIHIYELGQVEAWAKATGRDFQRARMQDQLRPLGRMAWDRRELPGKIARVPKITRIPREARV